MSAAQLSPSSAYVPSSAILAASSVAASLSLGRSAMNYIDPRPEGRSFFHRYATVTLPDNAIPALAFWLNRIVDIRDPSFRTPEALLLIPIFLGTAQLIEWSRWLGASVISKVSHPVARTIAQIIGPRDFKLPPV